MTALTFEATKHGYAHLWDAARVTNVAGATKEAARISATAARAAYVHVEKLTAVPWWMVAVIHMRESSFSWTTYLGNGQALGQITTIVPKGRGPFADWYAGAVDALTLQGIAGFDPRSWTIERALYWLERYNGTGYFGHAVNDPYLWSWTDQYKSGKFVADGKFDANVVDQQPGCAAVLKTLEAQGLVTFTREAAAAAVPQPKKATMTTAAPAAGSLPVDQIESMIETADKLFAYAGPVLATFLPTNLKDAVPLITAALPMVEMALKMESAREHGLGAAAQAAILRAAADKLDPPAKPAA